MLTGRLSVNWTCLDSITTTPTNKTNKQHRQNQATCGREGLYTAGYLGIVPTVSRTLEENYGMSATAGAVIGSIASGLIAATLSHPLDTIKTCMQGDVERKRYHNMRQTVRIHLVLFFESIFFTHIHNNTGKSNSRRIWYSRILQRLVLAYIENDLCSLYLE